MHRGIAAALVATAAVGLAPLPAQAATGAKGPHLSFTQGVYKSADHGAGCDHAANYAEATTGDPVTYCFIVTNTGTTSLASVTLNDPAVGTPMVLSGDPKLLAPGATARWYLETTAHPDEADGKADDTFANVATVSATPADSAGKPLAGAALLTAQAGSQVYPPEVVPAPALNLQASVYTGHDGGAHCPSRDIPMLNAGDSLTWCYAVTNTGNTRLAGVSFADLGVQGQPVLVSGTLPLAPGAAALYYLEGAVPGGAAGTVESHPAARAAAVDDKGRELAGVSLASASTSAALQVAGTAPQPTTPQPTTPQPTDPASTMNAPTPNLVVEDPSLAPTSTTQPAAAPVPAGVKAKPAGAKQTAKPAKASETTTGGRSQLAYTGWETWLLLTLGVGLLAVGWLLIDSSRRRSTTV